MGHWMVDRGRGRRFWTARGGNVPMAWTAASVSSSTRSTVLASVASPFTQFTCADRGIAATRRKTNNVVRQRHAKRTLLPHSPRIRKWAPRLYDARARRRTYRMSGLLCYFSFCGQYSLHKIWTQNTYNSNSTTYSSRRVSYSYF